MFYTTRSNAKILSAEFPIGDPFGGPAYGKREDIGSALSIGSSLLGSSMQAGAAEDAANTTAGASKYATDLQKQIYDQTRSDQAPWRTAGGNALSQLSYLMGLPEASGTMNRDSLRSELLPQYTTQTAPNSMNSYMADQIRNQMAMYADNQFGEDYQNLARQLSAIQTQGGQSIDESGLNAAINQRMTTQARPQGADYGSLSKSFTMDDYQADPGYKFRMDQGTSALQNSAAARGGLKSGNTLKALMEYGQNLGSQEYGNAYNRFNTDQNTKYNRLSTMAGLGQTANNSLQSAGTNYANSVGNLSMNSAANQGNALLSGANSRASSFAGIGNTLGNYFGGQGSSYGNPPTGFGYGEPLDWGVSAFG